MLNVLHIGVLIFLVIVLVISIGGILYILNQEQKNKKEVKKIFASLLYENAVKLFGRNLAKPLDYFESVVSKVIYGGEFFVLDRKSLARIKLGEDMEGNITLELSWDPGVDDCGEFVFEDVEKNFEQICSELEKYMKLIRLALH